MAIARTVTFKEVTTLGVGGPMASFARAFDAEELVAHVAEADAAGTPVLIVGGGSNLVVSDDGFDGLVVRPGEIRTSFLAFPDGSIVVEEAAGRSWDALVAECVKAGRAGIEALSGIPGTVGAAPIQNIGAYGQELASTLESVTVYDRLERRIVEMENRECGFGYRDSLFKHTARFVILRVRLRLRLSKLSEPIQYEQLADAVGVAVGARAPLEDVREAVLALRRSKGMVIDLRDPDSRSAGSFFMNPIVDNITASSLPAGAPKWPVGGGLFKLSAAWLIQNAGFDKGYTGAHPEVGLSSKHTLAIVNRGGATTAQVLELAREVRDGVQRRYGVTLEPEPRLVGVTLD